MVKDQYIWKRRRDLANHTFWAISQTWSPFITHMTSPPSEVVVKGLYADIMDVLAARLNFSVKVGKLRLYSADSGYSDTKW